VWIRQAELVPRPSRALTATAYGLLALTDTVLAAAPAHWHRARLVTKPLLMPALAASTDGRPALRAAQAFSWGGDVALLKEGEGAFLTGLGSFLAAHVAYVAAYRARSSTPLLGTPGRRRLLAAGAVSAAGMAVAAGRRDRTLAGPVAAYGLVLATMVTAAAAVDPGRGRRRVLAGASLFMASDTLLGLRSFVLEDGGSDALEGVVMATYTTAQWLIGDGMTRG
jgi:uncharacterized membrane protein YhhN